MPKPHISDWLTPEALLRLTAWARDGLTDVQIFHNMGIGKSTFYDWQNKAPEMRDALKKGKETVDIEVENALLRKATGYECTETKTVTLPDGGTRTETVTKHIPPDTVAIIYWLKNRKPEKWRDKPEASDSETIDKLTQLLDEQRAFALMYGK